MKAYILNIEFIGSKPLIWRQIIMPADATFNRLHDVIQNVTNFQSGYPHAFYHLFEFDLIDLKVTNDQDAYYKHKHFIENKKFYASRLKSSPAKLLEYEEIYQSNLKIQVRQPTSIKIDKYVEDLKTIDYTYDYRDNWQILISLEAIVDDYYFGYPTLIKGAEKAPPEDVGGIDNYYNFLEAFNDSNHPDHNDAKTWAKSVKYQDYDIEYINQCLKTIKYKKTEWHKINHIDYRIISDKYRKE